MTPYPLSRAEIEANAALVAATLLGHPVALLMTAPAVERMADIATRGDLAAVSDIEVRFLDEVLDFADAVEIRLGLEAS